VIEQRVRDPAVERQLVEHCLHRLAEQRVDN
jgi:hypothetical protein